MTICATCENFVAKLYPEHKREGLGRCIPQPVATFRWWGAPACGKYLAAKNLAEREAWVAKQGRMNANSGD